MYSPLPERNYPRSRIISFFPFREEHVGVAPNQCNSLSLEDIESCLDTIARWFSALVTGNSARNAPQAIFLRTLVICFCFLRQHCRVIFFFPITFVVILAVLLRGGDKEETAFAYLSVLSRDSVGIVTVDSRRCVSYSPEPLY